MSRLIGGARGCVAMVIVFTAALTGCGAGTEDPMGATEADAPPDAESECANVVEVVVAAVDGGYDFDVTVRSGDTGWEKYADRWEVRGPDGEVIATRDLLHPHETEQPFTRSLGGVVVPEGLSTVRVAAHDSILGFCGTEARATLPDRS